MESKALKVGISGIFSVLTVYFNALSIPLIVLTIAMLVDYLTGLSAASKEKGLSSKKGIQGIIKKVGYFVLVLVAMGVDWLIYYGMTMVNIQVNCNLWFGILVTIWLIINEMISILENLSRLGVPMPKFLTSVIKRLKITTETAINTSEESEGNNDA